MNFKKFLIGAATAGLLLSSVAGAAFAAPGNDGTPPPGQAQAGVAGAQCDTSAASGAFGFYAHGWIPDNLTTPRGADGTQTGLNNSAVCGNRQGNL